MLNSSDPGAYDASLLYEVNFAHVVSIPLRRDIWAPASQVSFENTAHRITFLTRSRKEVSTAFAYDSYKLILVVSHDPHFRWMDSALLNPFEKINFGLICSATFFRCRTIRSNSLVGGTTVRKKDRPTFMYTNLRNVFSFFHVLNRPLVSTGRPWSVKLKQGNVWLCCIWRFAVWHRCRTIVCVLRDSPT